MARRPPCLPGTAEPAEGSTLAHVQLWRRRPEGCRACGPGPSPGGALKRLAKFLVIVGGVPEVEGWGVVGIFPTTPVVGFQPLPGLIPLQRLRPT